MSHRFLTTSIMSLCLLACGGSSQEADENVARPRAAESSGSEKAAARSTKTAKVAQSAPDKAGEAPLDAKTAEFDEDPSRFAGVDTSAPKDDEDADGPREVIVEGIEGTTSRYDVRTTLENRDADFDSCHDRMGGGGGKLVFKIHILANGDVGNVKVSRIKSRNKKLVDCYTEVVSTSHFMRPHGGYADVKWTTKVGRSRKRPDAIFERPVRWDAPASAGGTRRAEAEGRSAKKKRQSPDGA